MKYGDLIRSLDPEQLYTPGTIALFASENGYIEASTLEKRRSALLRIRIAMGRFSNNHPFPDRGDGMVIVKGQAPTPGWHGWRWQKAFDKRKP